jgi:hypothetical protein
LDRALEPLHARYDSAERMIRRPFSSPGYHTTLQGGFVHPTRDSLGYAVALLDTGEEPGRQRAIAILERVLALQDQNPTNKTYGIWPWFLEESLEQMSPPDWNWADFCGVALLQIALDHRERLPADLARRIEAAILHAARSIRKRNVGPGYTNIAIMGTYVTLIAGELFGWAEFKDYGLERLCRFHEYTTRHGAFTEYNSPTYTIVALEELGRLQKDAQTPEARAPLADLYRRAWEEIAHHFHAPTRQWAGPHSRAYSTLLGESARALVQRATDGRADFAAAQPSLTAHRLPLPCPRALEDFFTSSTPRELKKVFVQGERPLVGTTYFEPAFCLGSINRQDMWNQRRNLIGYFGDARNPSYVRLRFLRDGYDLAAARFWSQQSGGRILAALSVATDGGDTHPSLDRLKQATLRAQDLRVRFEVGGAAGPEPMPAAPAELSAPLRLRYGEVTVEITVPFARWGESSARWEVDRKADTAWADVVLYSGEARTFRLDQLTVASVGLGLRMATDETPSLTVASRWTGETLEMNWDGLSLRSPTRPNTADRLDRQVTH